MRGECACGCVCMMWGAWCTRVCTHGHACVDLCCYCAIETPNPQLHPGAVQSAAAHNAPRDKNRTCNASAPGAVQSAAAHNAPRDKTVSITSVVGVTSSVVASASASHLLSASRHVSSHLYTHGSGLRASWMCPHTPSHSRVKCDRRTRMQRLHAYNTKR